MVRVLSEGMSVVGWKRKVDNMVKVKGRKIVVQEKRGLKTSTAVSENATCETSDQLSMVLCGVGLVTVGRTSTVKVNVSEKLEPLTGDPTASTLAANEAITTIVYFSG